MVVDGPVSESDAKTLFFKITTSVREYNYPSDDARVYLK